MSVDQKIFLKIKAAIKAGSLAKVEKLISNEINSGKEYVSLIIYAISSSEIAIAKLLIKNGGQLSNVYKEDNQILHLAVVKGDTELVQMLIERKSSTQLTDKDNLPPLFKVVNRFSGDSECSAILDTLLRDGAHINYKRKLKGTTVLHHAAELGNHEIIPLLRKSGCHLNMRSRDGSTPLHVAAKNGHSKIVLLLLENGAKHNIPNCFKKTPLYSAIESGDLTTFEILLNYRRTKTSTKAFQLHQPENHLLVYEATKVGNKAMLELLFLNGAVADCNSPKSKNSALYLAISNQNEAIVDLLLKHEARLDIVDARGFNLLHLACEKGSLPIVSSLLEKKKFDLNTRTIENFTALHLASKGGYSQIVSLLLEQGADYKLLDKNNKTSLTVAIESTEGNEQTLKIFLNHIRRSENSTNEHYLLLPEVRKLIHYQKKALRDKTEESPLHTAVEKEDLAVVNLLVKYGAWVDSLDKNKCSPFYLATKNGSLPIINAILNCRSNPVTLFKPEGENGYTPMHIAVETENVDILKLFLKSGISANISAKNGLKPLHIAVRTRQENLIHLLLKYGADIHASGQNSSETPLFIAAEIGNPKIIHILSEASPNRSSNWIEGYIPLYIAAYHGHKDVVKLFLDKGVDPNANLEKYLTPLHAAAQKGHEKVVGLLLERGAKANPRRNDEKNTEYISTPLLAASHAGRSKIVDLLLENGANFNAQLKLVTEKSTTEAEKILIQGSYEDSEIGVNGSLLGYSSLHFAVEAGNLRVVKLLMKKGASINVNAGNGAKPLGFAIEKEAVSIVQHLLSSGANVFLDHKKKSILSIETLKTNWKIAEMILRHGSSASGYRYHSNFSPLTIAIQNELEFCVQKLLETRADPNSKHKNDPVLHFAVRTKNSTIVKLLLKHGADINASTKHIGTALSVAVNIEATNIVRDLLEAGADTKIPNTPLKSIQDYNNCTTEKYKPLIVAVMKKNAEIVELFLKKESNDSYSGIESPFHIALKQSSKDVVNKFLNYGVSIHSKDGYGMTPIFHAVKANNLEVVKFLLMKGSSLNRTTARGVRLLYLALKAKCNQEILQLLIDYGIDINIEDEEDLSPLNMIINERYHFSSNLLKLFLMNGADPNTFDGPELELPLEFATRREDPDFVKILLLNGADINLLDTLGETPLENAIKRALDSSEKYDNDPLNPMRVNNNELDNLEYDCQYLRRFPGEYYSGLTILPFRKIVRLMTQEIARLEAIHKKISKENKNIVKIRFVKRYYERCRKEILQMIVTKIFSGVTYFDILAANESKLAAYARNEDIVKTLLSENCKNFFPEYAEVLKDRIEMGKERKLLLESSYESLKEALQFKFPILIIEEIFSYLTSRDLRNLANACKKDMFLY